MGVGTTTPSAPLSVGATSQFQVSSAGAVTAVGVNSGSGLIQGTGGLTIIGTVSLPNSSITNAMLANSTISGIALGSNLSTLTFGTHLTGTSYNGSTGVTLGTDATDANTASTIVARDASGNFSAGTITGSLTGHSSLDLPLAGGTMTGGITNSTSLNPLTTLAESWIGPSSTTGVYFKGGNVGVGTTSPDSLMTINANTVAPVAPPATTYLHLVGADSATTRAVIDTYSGIGILDFRRAAGTAASPSALASGAQVGSIGMFGYGTTGYSSGSRAQINFMTDEAWTDTAQGSRITFFTNTNGATSLTERMRIDNAGSVGIGITSPTSLLHTVSSAAKTTSYTGVLHSVTDTSSTASINKIGMDIESTGTWNGTSAVNTGLVVNATGGTTNYAATFSGGNVGIGTTSPGANLNILASQSQATASYNRGILFESYGSGAYGGKGINVMVAGGTKASPTTVVANDVGQGMSSFYYDGTTWRQGANIVSYVDSVIAGTSVSSGFKIRGGTYTGDASQGQNTGQIDIATFTPAGSVGIGITAPTSLLHTVSSAAKTTSYTGVLHSVTDTSSTASINKIGMDIESTGTWNGTSAINTGLVVNATGGTTNYAATFSGGNVGIGTATPMAQTEIYGAGQLTAALTDAGVKTGTLAINSNSGSAGAGGAIVFGNSQSETVSSIGYAAIKGLLTNGTGNTIGDLAFSTRNATGDTALTERMRILSSGNVGIGTVTPTYKLYVNNDVTNPTSAVLGIGSYVKITNNLSTDTYDHFAGNFGINPYGSQNYTGSVRGIAGSLYHYGTGTITNGYGMLFYGGVMSTGNITNLSLAKLGAYGTGTGVINTIKGLDISSMSDSGTPVNSYAIYVTSNTASSGTNKYGLYIGDISGAATANYALYSSSGTNYFGGNVGIGITAPTSLLHTVSSAAKTTAYTGILHSVTDTSSTASINKIGMDIESTGTWNGTSAVNTGLVVNATGGTTNYAATFSGGNVGIGTTTPSGILHAVNSALTSTAIFERSGQTSNSIFAGVRVLTTKTSDMGDGFGTALAFNIQDDAGVINPIGSIGAVRNGADNTGNLVFYPYNAGSATLAMTINNNGSVGIGTTSPTSLLHTVSSAAKTTAYTGILHNVTDTSSTASINKIGMDIESTGTWNGTSAVNTGLVVNATGGTTNYAATFSGGNVGIGTATPGYKLDVAGAGHFSGNLTLDTGASQSFVGIFSVTGSDSHAIRLYPSLAVGSFNGLTQAGDSALIFTNGSVNTGNLVIGPWGNYGLRITNTGSVGVGVSSPTAYLHLNAGTATASTAPLKFTSGTNLTTAEAGAMEYDGTQLYFSPSTTRNILAQVSGSTALTAGSIPFISTTSGYLTQNNANFFWDNTNNRLGVGTTSPTQMLSVGSSSQFNVTSAGAITATKITSSLTYTTTSGTSMTDNPIIYSNPTAGTSGSYRAGVFQAVQQGSYNNTGNIMGINGQAQHQGTGTLANAYGLNFAVYNAPGAGNTNVLTNAYGVYSFVMNQGTVAGAVISNAYSLYAGGLNNGSGGTVTNTYGVYIESQTAGIQTNSPFGLYQAGASDKNYFAGNVGIGTTSPGAPLEVKGSVTHATIAKFTDASDTTSCTFSSGGLIACSSDARLKKNVEDMNYGLSTVMSLRPVLYNWNYETDGSVKNLGFIAQEVEALVPKLVSTDEEGMKSLNSIGMVPSAIKAIQELNLNLEGVAGTVTPIPGSSSESFVTAFFTNIKIKIGTWLADAGNGIGNVFANVFNAKEKICVDGECLTKDDVHALLLLAHPPSTTSEPVTDQPSAETPAPTEPATPPSTSASAVEPVVETPTPEVTTPSTDSGQTSSLPATSAVIPSTDSTTLTP